MLMEQREAETQKVTWKGEVQSIFFLTVPFTLYKRIAMFISIGCLNYSWFNANFAFEPVLL